jgi:uncharacterized protein (TIGR03437 family)
MHRIIVLMFVAGITAPHSVGQFAITATPNVSIRANEFGEILLTGQATVFDTFANGPYKFKVDRIESQSLGDTSVRNYIIVTPSEGSTPGRVFIGPNPNVLRTLRPNRYFLYVYFSTIDQTPPSYASTRVTLDLDPMPAPKIESIGNAATGTCPISPGMLVAISGTTLGPPVFASTYDNTGKYPTEWGRVKVTFDGREAPVLYVSPGRIYTVVPYAVSGKASTDVMVTRNFLFQQPPPVSVAVAETAPAIFTSSQDGAGAGGILVYPGGQLNSTDNPATAGSIISFFTTGEGVWDSIVSEGNICVDGRRFTAKPVTLTVGGQPARILYAGAAPYSAGRFQVNAQLPAGISPGLQPVILKIGDADNASQNVTLAVQ